MPIHEADECGVCRMPSFERNNYFHGKTLTARDLFAEQRYVNEKRWLINRTVFGAGVVCGLDVTLDGDCLIVSPGLAFDCCGHEVLVCDRHAVPVRTIGDQVGGAEPVRWMLCLEYREVKIEPVALPGVWPGDDEARQSECEGGRDDSRGGDGREPTYNRIRDGYCLRVRPATEACLDDRSIDGCPQPDTARTTPIQKTLVERSRKCPSCGECDCLVLATGWLTPPSSSQSYPRPSPYPQQSQYAQPTQYPQQQSPQPYPAGGGVRLDEDAWKYRRTVPTNLALADLFRCFHGGLAHIASISWIPSTCYTVESFLAALRDGLKVVFDRPMDSASVRNVRSCRLAITVMPEEQGCPVQILVPVRRIDCAGTTATYHFDAACAEYELRRSCQKHQRPADVELVLHGSMIHDTADRALDAELIRDFPTGNGVEGGEFVACYTVEP